MDRAAATLVGILGLLQAENALAFTVNIEELTVNGQTQDLLDAGWQSSTVTLDVDTSCDNYTTYVNTAMAGAISLWNKVPSANLTVALGTTVELPQAITTYVGDSATSVAPAGNPIIVCDSNFTSDTGEDASDIPGFAGAFNLDSTTGQKLGALLVLNVQSGAAASITTLAASEITVVLAHETGHILGLGHSADINALMYYQTSASKVAALAQDDVAGITFLYPRQEPSSGGAFGCGTMALVGGPGSKIGKKGRSSHSSGPPHGGLSPALLECLGLLIACSLICRISKRDRSKALRVKAETV